MHPPTTRTPTMISKIAQTGSPEPTPTTLSDNFCFEKSFCATNFTSYVDVNPY